MAGVLNQEARQRTLKVRGNSGAVTVVRLKPGFNVVPDKDWEAVKSNPAVKELEKSGVIISGNKATAEQEADKDLRAQTKVVSARALAAAVAGKEAAVNSQAIAEKRATDAEADTVTEKTRADEAEAKLKAAEEELTKLKKAGK